MSCGYIIKVKGTPLLNENGSVLMFATDEELDSWLYENRDSLLPNIDHLDIIAELTPLQSKLQSVSVLNDFALKSTQKDTRISVTDLWGNVDPHKLTQKDSFEESSIKRIMQEDNVSRDEAKKIFDDLQKDTSKKDAGTAIHKILELKFNGKKLGYDSEIKADLSSDKFKKDIDFIDDFISTLGKTFKAADGSDGVRGVDYEILTETSIATSIDDMEARDFLQSIFGDNRKYILGKMDLVVITRTGQIHVYDYKTSNKRLGTPSTVTDNWYNRDVNVIKSNGWLSNVAKDTYEAQVMSYISMLQQALNTSNVYGHIVKFHMGDDNHIDDFEGVVNLQNSTQITRQLGKIFGKTISITNKDTKTTNEQISGILGSNVSVARKSEGFIRNVEVYLNSGFLRQVDQNSNEYKKGYTHFFRDDIHDEIVYCKGIEGDEGARKKVTKYIKELNKNADKELLDFAKDLKACKTKEDLEKVAQKISYKNHSTIVRTFEKYITQHWKFVDNEELNGNGIFLFEKDNKCEIMMLETAEGLHRRVQLRKGTSILGNVLRDDDKGVDSRFYLDASVGNMLLMKAVSFISNHADYFRTKRVSRISAFNPIFGDSYTNTPLSVLAHNWQTLAYLHPKLNLRLVDELLFPDAQACVETAKDLVNGISDYYSNIKLFTIAKDQADYTEEQLLEMLKSLSIIGPNNETVDPKLRLAYGEIYKALLMIRGQYRICVEADLGEFLSKGLFFTGGYFSPFALSPSANLRIINEMSITFHNKIADEVHKVVIEWQKRLRKAWKGKTNDFMGGQWSFFEPWFVTDESGNIDKSFRLKDPRTDSYFRDKPDEAELCKFFLDTLAKLRWGDDWENRIGSFEYYEVPLCEARNIEILETSKGLTGITKVAKKKWDYAWNVGQETINGKRVEVGKYSPNKSLDIDKIYNPYFEQSHADRENELNDKYKGPSYFEKNLDIVFLNTIVTSIKSKLSTKFLPLFTGMRTLMSIENLFNDAKMKEIAQAMDKYIDSVVLNNSFVPDSLQPLKKLLSEIQGLVSKITIGLKSVAFVRENLGNIIRAGFQAAVKDPRFVGTEHPYSDGFEVEEYLSCLLDMMEHWKEGFTSDSKDMQLNTMFRMANMSYREISKNLQTGKYGLKNITDDFWFITSTTPDFLHRVAILKATLKHIGAYDAYIMEDGILKYDWTKDKRFNLLFKYADDNIPKESDVQKISDFEEKKRWNEQSEQYKTYLKFWNKTGEKLKYGDPLPQALDPIQQNNAKTRTDILFGNYDDESKSLIQRTLLGGMFFQFKTYGISRMIEWWRQGGAINIILPSDMKDENGKQLYIRYATEQEILEGKPWKTIITEDELTQEDLDNNKVTKFQDYTGTPNEGRIQSVWAYVTAIVKNDSEEMKRLWNDPHKRANLLASLHDTWLMVIIAGLVRLLYGDEVIETMNEQDWWTRWTHAVLMGVAQDGPVWEVAKSIWSNGEIPAMSALSKYVTTAMSVINGNTYVLNGFINTVGATKEFSNLISN